MLDFSIATLGYSEEEKNKCFEVIQTMLTLSQRACRYGRHILDWDYQPFESKPRILRKGIRLILDGIDPEEVRNALDNYINARNYIDIELLEAQIMREGVLLIHAGEGEKTLFEKLVAMLGDGFYQDIKDQDVFKFEKASLNSVQEELSSAAEEKLFEDAITNIEELEDMERLLRMAGHHDMGYALLGVSKKVYEHVLTRINPRD